MEEQATPAFSYSPDRRTALVLCGTGAHGAYHAGVLHALQEAGVKIDLMAGHGIGAAGAALGAIDGASRLWDADGIWQSRAPATFYGWTRLLRVAGWMAAILAGVLLIPLVVLLIGLALFLVGFMLTLLGIDAGQTVTSAYGSTLTVLFANENLPTVVPRLAMAVLVLLVAVSAGGVLLAQSRAAGKRHAVGGWWWRLLAAPVDAGAVRHAVAAAVWQLIRGAGPTALPSYATLGRRYSDVLSENLGQPGFRELILAATDVDARRDAIAFLLREPYRHDFVAPQAGLDRRTEVIDLAGAGREHAFDLINAALTPPVICDPALVTFASDSVWRGETHRLCDRPGLTGRLLDEVANAGVTQVIVVSAHTPAVGPHRLATPRLDIRHRLADFTTAAEAASLRDALIAPGRRFEGVYLVSPTHNPIGPFDFGGAYDSASDRRETLTELMHQGYEDAYRQFVEPVVGASGDQLTQAAGLTNHTVR